MGGTKVAKSTKQKSTVEKTKGSISERETGWPGKKGITPSIRKEGTKWGSRST